MNLKDEDMLDALSIVNSSLREIRDEFENLNGQMENRMGNEVLVEQKDIF